jgi:hypothetical protein
MTALYERYQLRITRWMLDDDDERAADEPTPLPPLPTSLRVLCLGTSRGGRWQEGSVFGLETPCRDDGDIQLPWMQRVQFLRTMTDEERCLHSMDHSFYLFPPIST